MVDTAVLVVRVFKTWAGEHGRSADAAPRASQRDMPRSASMNQKAPKAWPYLSGVAIQAQLRAFAA
jgi:hypothetical protein